jgi:hypothetical protein
MPCTLRHVLPVGLLLLLSGCGSLVGPAATQPTTEPSTRPAAREIVMARRAGRGIFLMPGPGTFRIVDERAGTEIWSTSVRAGQEVVFLPEENRIYLNGVVVREGGLSATRMYRFVFQEEKE